MKKLWIGSVAFVAAFGCGSAMAADLPVYKAAAPIVAGYDWTGGYIGVNAGYAWGTARNASTFTCPAGAGCSVTAAVNLADIVAAASQSFSANGFTGGGQAGYNWQTGAVVFGAEVDFNVFNLKGTQTTAVPSATTASIFNPSISVTTNWLLTLRGRLGWTVTPMVLLYATGGLAVTDVNLSNAYTTTNNPGNTAAGASSTSVTRAGWTIGGGLEWALNRNWTVKGEYLYADFGSVTTSANVIGPGFANPNVFTTSTQLIAHIARAGLNFRF